MGELLSWLGLLVGFLGVLVASDVAIGVFYKARAWWRRRRYARAW